MHDIRPARLRRSNTIHTYVDYRVLAENGITTTLMLALSKTLLAAAPRRDKYHIFLAHNRVGPIILRNHVVLYTFRYRPSQAPVAYWPCACSRRFIVFVTDGY